MPIVSVATTTTDNMACLRRLRAAYRTSCHNVSRWYPTLTSRTFSLTCSLPPSSISAARRASAGSRPSLIFCSISISRYASISSVSSRSLRALRNRLRQRLDRRASSGMIFLLRRLKRLRDGQRDALPGFGFGFERALSSFGQAVILCPAVVLGLPPGGSEPPRLFHAVQRRKKRAGFDLENSLCDLRNAV